MMILHSHLLLSALLSLLLAAPTCSWNTPRPVSRAGFLSQSAAVAAVVLTGGNQAASAKEVDPALKGTKKDPAYETCISQCMYECTKPKVPEQKSRQECLPECKAQCATTKQQLMIGNPLSNKV
jgi:hypothetical protein